jgi:hypothetical protein
MYGDCKALRQVLAGTGSCLVHVVNHACTREDIHAASTPCNQYPPQFTFLGILSSCLKQSGVVVATGIFLWGSVLHAVCSVCEKKPY